MAKEVTLTLALPDGTRKYFRGKTRKEAEEKREQAKLKLAQGWNIGSKLTFKEAAEVWLDEYKARKDIHIRTYETTSEIFKRYLIPNLGELKLIDIRPAHIDRMLCNMADLSKSTQSKALTYSNAVFMKAVENDVIPKSPCLNKRPIAKAPEKVRALTPDQCERLLDAVKGTRVYPFVVVLLFCGLRKGEALGLMWKDIDFKNRILSVERSVVHAHSNRDGLLNYDLKTASSRRKIPMSQEVVEVLRKEKAKSESVYVFAMRDGQFLSEASFRSMWRLIEYRTIGGKSTGDFVTPTLDFTVHPHQLRHTCCTRWLANGMTPKEAQYLMGHATSDVTMDVYAEYQAEQQREITAKKISNDELARKLG